MFSTHEQENQMTAFFDTLSEKNQWGRNTAILNLNTIKFNVLKKIF